jgi:HdeA/HdeB family
MKRMIAPRMLAPPLPIPRIAALLLAACLLPLASRAAEYNLATLSCDKYENEIVGSPDGSAAPDPAKHPDPIDTVMWLFGYSVGVAGEHVMYGDALTSFGFALDAECKNNPSTSLLQALRFVRPKRDKPMDLMTLNCKTFEGRHAESTQNDPASANTIMMWLFGYSVAQSGSHIFDASKAAPFATTLQSRCAEHPEESLYDVLADVSRAKH